MSRTGSFWWQMTGSSSSFVTRTPDRSAEGLDPDAPSMRNFGLVTIQQGKYAQSHIRHLEAESVHVLREVLAEFERPVLLYSIGKDSSVLLRLAQKAFYPG